MNPPVTDPEAREALERVRKAIVAALPENIPLRGRMSRWIMEQAVGPAIAERDATIATLTARVEALEGALTTIATATPEPDDKIWYVKNSAWLDPELYYANNSSGETRLVSVNIDRVEEIDAFGYERGLHAAAVIARAILKAGA